jgi:hypothetical protein
MPANRNTISCPHCHGRVRTQTSRQLSTLVREIYYECVDVDCGHRFVAQLGIVRTLVPSLKPSKDVTLPIVERRPHNDIIVPSARQGAGQHPTASQPPKREANERHAPMALN